MVNECTWCDEGDGNSKASRGMHKLVHKLYAVARRKARPRVLQQWQAMGRVARTVTTWTPRPRPGQEGGSEFSQSCNMVLWRQHGPPLPCKLVGVHKGRPVVRHEGGTAMASIDRLSKIGDAPQAEQMSTKHLADMAALEAQCSPKPAV